MIRAGALVVHSIPPAGMPPLATISSSASLCASSAGVSTSTRRSTRPSWRWSTATSRPLLLGVEKDLPDETHDVVAGYARQCAISVTATDLAIMGATLTNGGRQPRTGEQIFDAAVRQCLGVMATCGMYDDRRLGLRGRRPIQERVACGILAVSPGRLGSDVWSPFDEHGISVRDSRW
ncbi:glutaminase [Tessaracoccus flavescens]|uniref:glutaminase n=1 Tax=Tessaracoccus flavescens TaxID=399497 RepID=A0A1Q2CVI1_9ACTN|nr:glutaminase [Tessaracoccus flavescens]AQP50089.1 hypothetical protein BW733_03815 [Tessaracoccus flavescens]